MGYREDQFYNLNKQNIDSTWTARDNPKFMYPGDVAQTLAYPGKNSGFRDLRALSERKTVKRGFITSLLGSNTSLNLTPGERNNLKRKMFFQFNPPGLTQAVQWNEDVTNPFLQNPGNWATPQLGASNFTFEIFLDRQMEMNQPTQIVDEDVFGLAVGDPRRVGVLADLVVLYRIIGQGLDAQTQQVFKQLYERSQAYSTDPADTSADQASTAIPISAGGSAIDPNINAGNYAFLASLPVRVVFSSLFMVDGFVTGTSVYFSKFNANMVPVQCSVTVSMQAMYLGFAREKTAFNFALEDATIPEPAPGVSSPTPVDSGGKDPADLTKLDTFQSAVLRSFRIAASRNLLDSRFWNTSVRSDALTRASGGSPTSDWSIRRLLGANFINCKFGFPLLSASNDPISSFYDSSTPVVFTVQYSFTVNLSRRTVGAETSTGTVFNLGSFSISSGNAPGLSNQPVISTKASWNKASKVTVSAKENIQIEKPSGSGLGSPDYLYLPNKAAYDNFVATGGRVKVIIDFNMQVTIGTGSAQASSRSYVRKLEFSAHPDGYLDSTFSTISDPTSTVGRERT